MTNFQYNFPEDFKPQEENIKLIDLKTTITWLYEGIIFIYTKPNIQHTYELAIEQQNHISKLVDGKRLPIIGDSRKALPLDKKTRHYYSSIEGTIHAASFAFLVDSNFSKVFANIFIKLVKLQVPTRMFSNVETAIKWSNKFK